MISLINNIKEGLKRANQFKIFVGILFLSLSYICVPETRSYAINGMMYLIIPEIIKNVNTKIIQKDDSTILSYKCIFLEYSHKLIEVSFYTAIIDNYNDMYYSVPNTLFFPMYIWRGFIEMHRYRYYCELIIGTIIITTSMLFYPFIKRFYNKFDLIISNITSIPVLTYRNLLNAISEGQSLHIEIENIQIISIPPKIKVNMTEEELENIAPKKMPINKGMMTRKIRSELNNCAICLDVINCSKEMSRILPNCKHSFHCHCIDNWFFSGHNICPICRGQVI
jgi:hypothetical protein